MKQGWRTLLKVILALAILGFVGRQFHGDLAHLDLSGVDLRPEWMALSAALYLAGLCGPLWFWRWLLSGFVADGAALGWRRPARAYFIGHLGKYIPGKAWAMLLRGSLLRAAGVPIGLAIVTAFYEVLTTMAAGAFVAVVVFIILPPEIIGLAWQPVYTGLLLLSLVGVPLLPGVFNLMLARLARRFPGLAGEAQGAVPRIGVGALASGLLVIAASWAVLGVAVWAMLCAVSPEPVVLDLEVWARLTGANALAYVAGFLAIIMPSGVGVREYFLLALLSFAGPEPLIALAVLLLRLTWTLAELVAAGLLWCSGS